MKEFEEVHVLLTMVTHNLDYLPSINNIKGLATGITNQRRKEQTKPD